MIIYKWFSKIYDDGKDYAPIMHGAGDEYCLKLAAPMQYAIILHNHEEHLFTLIASSFFCFISNAQIAVNDGSKDIIKNATDQLAMLEQISRDTGDDAIGALSRQIDNYENDSTLSKEERAFLFELKKQLKKRNPATMDMKASAERHIYSRKEGHKTNAKSKKMRRHAQELLGKASGRHGRRKRDCR